MAGNTRSVGRTRGEALLTEVCFYAVFATISVIALNFGLKSLDPNRANAKKAAKRKKEIAKRLGRPYLTTNEHEDIIAMDVIIPDQIDVTFDSIGGLVNIKKSLYELIILPLVRPNIFAGSRLLKPVKGCLMYGPPGTGKTMLAKAVAKESKACFINVRLSTIQSKWFGEAQKLVTAIFTLAWKLQPSIIFIDEIDSFLGQRKSSEHEVFTNMKTEFMSLWDGFTTDSDAQVMVLAATNRPWELDEAIQRRFGRNYEIPLPDAQQREGILKVLLRGEALAPDMTERHSIARLACKTEGFSGSDLQELCKTAAYNPVRDFVDKESTVAQLARSQGGGKEEDEEEVNLRPLEWRDFEESLATCQPSAQAAIQYQQNVNRQKAEAQGIPYGQNFGPSGGADPMAAQQLMAMAQTYAALLAHTNKNPGSSNGGSSSGS